MDRSLTSDVGDLLLSEGNLHPPRVSAHSNCRFTQEMCDPTVAVTASGIQQPLVANGLVLLDEPKKNFCISGWSSTIR